MTEQEGDTAAPTVSNGALTLRRVDDALWVERRPLLLVDKPRKKPGRPRHDDRPLLDGLIWLARSGGQRAARPREFGARSTVRDRFQEWVAHGGFAHAWARLLTVYDDAVGLDGGWPAADGCLVQARTAKTGSRRGGGDRGRPHRPGQVRGEAAPADRWAGQTART